MRYYSSWAVASVTCYLFTVVGLIVGLIAVSSPERSSGQPSRLPVTGPDTVRVWEATPPNGCATGQACRCDKCDCNECECGPVIELRIELNEPEQLPIPQSADNGFALLKSKVRVKQVVRSRCRFRC